MNIDLKHFEMTGDWQVTTARIQKAIDAVENAGGGRVRLDEGAYVVGAIQLRSGVELHLSEGAQLVGTTAAGAYPPEAWMRMVWADGATDIALTGPGTIDCQAKFEQKSVPPGPPLPYTTYVGGHYRNINSPRPVFFHGCHDVRISDVRLLNGGEWHCYLLYCERVVVDGLTIRQTSHSTWTDGIDIESCRDVVIQNCDIQTGDDAICIKTGKRGRMQASHNILVRNCTLASETNGFKIGNEVSYAISNVTVENCRIKAHPDREAAGPFGGISIVSADGASVSNIHISDIEMEDVRAPIFIKLGRAGGYRGGERTQSSLRNITLERITARVTDAKAQEGICSSITGYEGHCVENIALRDIHIEVQGGQTADAGPVPDIVDKYIEAPVFGVLPAYGLYARYVRNLLLESVSFHAMAADGRKAVVMEGVAPVAGCLIER